MSSGPQQGRIASAQRRALDLSKIKPCVGIDLGTSNTVVAFMDGTTQYIRILSGCNPLPSVVGFEKDGVVVGKNALDRLGLSQHVVRSSKRVIGRRFDDPKTTSALNLCNAAVVADSDGNAAFNAGGTVVSPKRVATEILTHIRNELDKAAEIQIRDAVITVPAYFTHYQRAATEAAAKEAGFNIRYVMNEPEAAGYVYGYGQLEEHRGTILVYDLGAGTFDVTILKCSENEFEMVDCGGNDFLGGDDVDAKIANWVEKTYRSDKGSELIVAGGGPKAEDVKRKRRAMLLKLCREAKEALSLESSVTIDLNEVNRDADKPLTLDMATLNKLIEGFVGTTRTIVEELMKRAKIEAKDIAKVIAVGGSSKLVAVSKLLIDMFGVNKVERGVGLDECVSRGACLYGAQQGQGPVSIQRVVQHVGQKVRNDGELRFVPIIEKGTRLPAKVTKTFYASPLQTKVSTSNLQGEDTENPDNNTNLGDLEYPLSFGPVFDFIELVTTMEMEKSGIVYVTECERMNGETRTCVSRRQYQGFVNTKG